MSRTPNQEEVYDLDDLIRRSRATQRRGQTYNLDDDGEPIRPLNRPRVAQSNAVKLPPVLIGQTRGHAPSGADLWAMSQDRRVRMTTTTVRESNMDWQRERSAMNGPRQPQREHFADQASHPHHSRPAHVLHGEAASARDRQQAGYRPQPIDETRAMADQLRRQICRSTLANQSRDAENIRFSQNAQREQLNRTFADCNNRPHYEERRVPNRHDSSSQPPLVPVPPRESAENNIRRNFRRVTGAMFPAPGSNPAAPSGGHEFERRYEQALQDHQRHLNEMARYTQPGHNDHGSQPGPYMPVPPSARTSSGAAPHVPVPPPGRPADHQSFNKTRRRVRNRSVALDQEVLKPEPAASYIPSPPKPVALLTGYMSELEMKMNEANAHNKQRKSDEFSDHFEIFDSDDDESEDSSEEDIDEFLNELDEMLNTPPLLFKSKSTNATTRKRFY